MGGDGSYEGYYSVASHSWAIVGDFNQILIISQHSNHEREDIDISGLDDFNLAIQNGDLFEAQAKGLSFSWWNNQDDNPVSKKIDYALINQAMSRCYQDAYSEFLPPDQSDHTPCLFHVPSLKRNPCKPFKFFHHVVDHPQYAAIIRDAWNCDLVHGTCQFKLLKALKCLKPIL